MRIRVRFALQIVTMVLAASSTLALAQNRTEQPGTFGATYDQLSVEQRALLDGLFRRAGAVLGVAVDPRERYEAAALSSRTTFDAVTHALLRSTLTDRQSGQSLGRTIDIIDYVEGVRGQVKGASGDQQFRLYVSLTPGARERIDNAKEFRRTADNAFFHQGYPISYRQEGYPSIQVSITQDGSRADIDVDYRSSRFPVALVNGHLSAANSDVRANFDRHNGKWSGLVNWWDGFLGSLFSSDVEVPEDGQPTFPTTPRAAAKTIDVAVDDFLRSWLVEGKPNLAVAYVDPAAYDCLARRLDREGEALDRGLAPLQLFVRMKKIGDALGPRQSLAGTTRPVRLPDPALRVVDHRRLDQYAIYGVPRAMAEQMSCASEAAFGRLPPTANTRGSREVYDNFYSTVAIDRADRAGAALGLLWQRRDGLWKIVSYQAVWEDAPAAAAMPDLRTPIAPAASSRMTADPALLQVSERFLDAWLVRKNYDEASALISPQAYACVNLYLDLEEPPRSTSAEQFARLRAGLERVSVQAGLARRLEEIIEPVEPSDARMGVVDHPRSKAFRLLAIPDWMGPAQACEARLARGDVAPTEEGKERGYGRYYISALRVISAGESGAVFALEWARNADAWRIVSFKVIEP